MTDNQLVITKSVLEHLKKSIEILEDSFVSVPEFQSEKVYTSYILLKKESRLML